MKTTEKAICSQLIHIAKTLVPLSNTQLPLGPCSNAVIRLITQLYIAMTNLTRHLIHRHGTDPISFYGLKYDQLARTGGKHLSSKVYGMITYIEENILPETNGNNTKKNNAHLNKLKVLSGTKFIPRMILCLETFNKFVIILSKKTKNDLSNNLHIGTVRDFRIKTNHLKEALGANNPEEDITDGNDEDEVDDDVYSESEEESEISPLESIPANNDENTSDNADKPTKKKFLENLKEINKQSKKKLKHDAQEMTLKVVPHEIPKKTKKRKKPEDIKSSDEESSNRRSSKRIKN